MSDLPAQAVHKPVVPDVRTELIPFPVRVARGTRYRNEQQGEQQRHDTLAENEESAMGLLVGNLGLAQEHHDEHELEGAGHEHAAGAASGHAKGAATGHAH